MKYFLIPILVLLFFSCSLSDSEHSIYNNSVQISDLEKKTSLQIDDSYWGIQFNPITPHASLTYESLDTQQIINGIPILLDYMKKSGVKYSRYSVNWSTVEDSSGTYHWKIPDMCIDGLTKNKIIPYVCITGGHSVYSGEYTPVYNEQSMKAWKKWVSTFVKRYADKIDYWELWNEPNYKSFWKPEPNASEYMVLLREYKRIIDSLDPGAKILGGSLARVDLPYAKELYEMGIDSLIDIFTVHPYNRIPEAVDDPVNMPVKTPLWYRKSNNTYSQIYELSDDVVLWQGECGYPSGRNSHGWTGNGPWGKKIQSKWLLRRLLSDIEYGAGLSGYFTLWEFDFGEDDTKINRKGLLRIEDMHPKKAYEAFQNLASVVDNRYKLHEFDSLEFMITDEGDFEGYRENEIFVTSFKKDNHILLMYWFTGSIQENVEPAYVKIDGVNIINNEFVDLLHGKKYKVKNGNKFPLTDYPIVLKVSF